MGGPGNIRIMPMWMDRISQETFEAKEELGIRMTAKIAKKFLKEKSLI